MFGNQEDKIILNLVQLHGTTNWSIIAQEMEERFGSNSRSGKQCRERFHNHLDLKINKKSWSQNEERVLFSKQVDLGNKWSEIANFLPGRTDNCIKNHFYSKLRKFIRKLLKIIVAEKENPDIDFGYYDSERLYKLIKKHKIPYITLNKDVIIKVIRNHEAEKNVVLNERVTIIKRKEEFVIEIKRSAEESESEIHMRKNSYRQLSITISPEQSEKDERDFEIFKEMMPSIQTPLHVFPQASPFLNDRIRFMNHCYPQISPINPNFSIFSMNYNGKVFASPKNNIEPATPKVSNQEEFVFFNEERN